jgi:hypothetical protein
MPARTTPRPQGDGDVHPATPDQGPPELLTAAEEAQLAMLQAAWTVDRVLGRKNWKQTSVGVRIRFAQDVLFEGSVRPFSASSVDSHE